LATVQGVSAEEAAEEENLRGQEDPHSQAGCSPLLLHIIELFGY
jgi:hypothetical protein